MIAINTRVRNVPRVILMEKDKLDINDFFDKAAEKHGLEVDAALEVKLFTNQKSPVDPEAFSTLAQQYQHDCNFYFEIVIGGANAWTVSTESLENYLRLHNCDGLFAEEARNNLLLPASQKKLFQRIRDFVAQQYSYKPTDDELIGVCQAAVTLFPSLKGLGSGGIDVLFDPVAKGGILYEKIRYQYRKKQKIQKQIVECDDDQDEDVLDEELDDEISGLVEFFNGVLLPRDRSSLLLKLEETANVRFTAIRRDKKDAVESSEKLYLVDPELILLDFKYIFNSVDDQALIDKWTEIERKPFQRYQISLDINVPAYHRHQTIHNFLTFLKLFSTHKYKFEKSAAALITFCDDGSKDVMTLLNQNTTHPTIICIYSRNDKSYKFYIDINKSVLSVPKEYSFVQVMDLYFKIHFIFQIEYEKSLTQFMAFFEKSVYNLTCSGAALTPQSAKKALTITE